MEGRHMLLLRVACVLAIQSGIAGVAVGDPAALEGWWLIVVFGAILLLTFVWRASQLAARR